MNKSEIRMLTSSEKLDYETKNTLYNSTSNSRSSKRISDGQASVDVGKPETPAEEILLGSNDISKPYT